MLRSERLLRGFTLIELMAVIVIIGMLMALLIPAVQRAREAARRTQCANNTKELATAIIQFDGAKDRLPYLNTTLPAFSTAAAASGYITIGWVPQILANLGRNDLYQIYMSNSTSGWAMYNAAGTLPGPPGNAFLQYLDTLVCPSDTVKPSTYHALPSGVPASVVATSTAKVPLSYAVNAGYVDIIPNIPSVYADVSHFQPDYQENGLFFSAAANGYLPAWYGLPTWPMPPPVQTSLTYVGKNDGTSMTILSGENMDATFWAVYYGDPFGTDADWEVLVPYIQYRDPAAGGGGGVDPINFPAGIYNNLAGARVYPQSFEDPHALTWQDLPDMQNTATPGPPTIGLNQGYNGLAPGDPGLPAALTALGPGYISRPSSPHPGGFHISFADGHTTFMNQDVAYQIYAQQMTPRGAGARVPGSGPIVLAAPGKTANPSANLLNWQAAPISDAALRP